MVVVLESVQPLADRNTKLFLVLEWGFTLLFNVEYIARLVCVQRPFRYATSFFGLVDLASVLPMYLALLAPGTHVLIDIRILRMLRAFRILKPTEDVREFSSLGQALHASRRKVGVFLSVVALVVVVLGMLDARGRGPGAWLHEHPGGHLLGDYHHDNGRVRRHRAADQSGAGGGERRDVARLGHPRRAHGHRDGRDDDPPAVGGG